MRDNYQHGKNTKKGTARGPQTWLQRKDTYGCVTKLSDLDYILAPVLLDDGQKGGWRHWYVRLLVFTLLIN